MPAYARFASFGAQPSCNVDMRALACQPASALSRYGKAGRTSRRIEASALACQP